jgi:hypothetical protein
VTKDPELLKDIFPLTAMQRARLEHLSADPADWREFAGGLHKHILKAYADHHLSFEEMIRLTNETAIGCTTADRVSLLGVAAADGLIAADKRGPAPKSRPPLYPMTLKCVAVDFMLMVEERYEGLPLDSDVGPSVLSMALDWVEKVRLFLGPLPQKKTLRGWYVANNPALRRPRRPGRPKNPRPT